MDRPPQFSLLAMLIALTVLSVLFAAAAGWLGSVVQATAWVCMGLPIAYTPFALLRALLFLTRSRL
jgi:type II secretory pathway component PulJ